MPTPTLPDISGDSKQVAEEVARLRKELDWLLRNQDHWNVKQLYTEHCNIQSTEGETVIDGPVLEMYDKQATPQLRLKAGYDEASGDFLFRLLNPSGVETVGLDSSGEAKFQTATGGVYIDDTGLAVYNGNFRMYDDGGLTAIIDGGTFYGDNFVVNSSIWVGEDIYMNADYETTQTRRIYPFSNDQTIYIEMGINGGFPSISFVDFNEAYFNSSLTCGGILIADGSIYMNTNDKVATEDWVSENFQPL